MSGIGQGGPTQCLGVVGSPSWLSAIGGRPSLMYGSGREALPDVLDCSGVPPGYPEVVK